MKDEITLEEFIVAEDRLNQGRTPFIKIRLKVAIEDEATDANDVVLVSVALPVVAGSSIEAYRANADRKAVDVLRSALAVFERAASDKA